MTAQNTDEIRIDVDDVAAASIAEMGTDARHLIGHHFAHLSRLCDCRRWLSGETLMTAPDGTRLLIRTTGPSSFAIEGHRS